MKPLGLLPCRAIRLSLGLLLTGMFPWVAPAAGLPQLRRQGTATQLIVDGQPFLLRGGELSNSHVRRSRTITRSCFRTAWWSRFIGM